MAQVLHHIAAANLRVVQNDTGNTTNSVTVNTTLSINDFRIRSGSTRADYNVQIGNTSTDDVTNGILMGAIDQNGRDNGELDTFPGMNYGTCSIDSNASSSPGSSGEFWLSVFQAPSNAEYNFNVAAAWFPYGDGWYGGWLNNSNGINGGANNHLIGNPNLVLGTHVVDQGSGKTKVDLRAFGLDSRSNAVLLVEGGKNEANFALSSANSDGTWTITCHDDNGGAEQDYVAFVCIPLSNHTVVSGRFMGDASIAMQSQAFQVVNSGNGTYHLSIPGVTPANGVLIISAEGGGSINGDNMVSYQTNGDGWDIQTRDITVGFTPELQNLDVSNAVVSFVYIPGPTPGSTSLRWNGTSTATWDFSTNQVWRVTTNNAPTQYVDGDGIIFDDTGSNFNVSLTALVSPYQLVVSNTANNYLLSGAGSITGSGGLIKQGAGKLTLAVTNSYAGDTVISQGTVTLNGVGGIPSGPGMGNVMMTGALDLNGFSNTVNNLSGSGSVTNSTIGAAQLKVYETSNSTLTGAIKSTAGSISLLLDGGGALTLAGINTINGGCIVSNGTLIINGSVGSGSVTVQSNGQLGGTGTISGTVSLAGSSSLDLTAGSPLTTGAITLNGPVTLNITSGVSLTNAATYVLLKHGARSGSGSFKLVLPPGLQANGFTASQADSGTQLQLIVTAAGITGTIADVRHVVLLMDENRAFDHYFGTFHGVRGFNDRNAIQLTNQNSVFFQPSGTGYELPFHNTLQCLTDLNHTWPVTHSTVNNGKHDGWIANKGAETMCYFDRNDLPVFYTLADAYTICDEYHCSVISSTDPNRFTFMTGMIDPNSTGGGPEIDNSSIPGGYTWRTYPEFLQQAGVSWKVYCVPSDDSDNVLPRFAAYKQATPGTPLYDRGRAGYADVNSLISGFASDVSNNVLPSVSWIIGPSAYTEHPPNSPANGQLFLKQILDGLAANPQVYNSTVFIFNYDENDGFFDHAMPILPPPGTPNEFVGSLPIGLGIRVPAIMISPWSHGGRVCSQVFDHTSTIRFLETWTGVIDTNISAWRRQVCGDLTSAFDFKHPNTNYPTLPTVSFIDCPSGSTPTVPTTQSLPIQESGDPIPMPLPYQPNASCVLDSAASTFTVVMTNSGTASVHFGVYANAFRTDGPWPFDVNTTNSTSTIFSTSATAGKYDFSCYGPNGFQRRFAGNISSDFQKIEALAFLNPNIAGIKIELMNASSASVTFAVSNGYVAGSLTNFVVPAHTTNVVNVLSETNNGYYDVTTTASIDIAFVRRFLGRVETVVVPTTFTSSNNPCSPGDSVTFTFTTSGYGTPTGTVQFSTNGVSAGSPVLLTNGTAAFTVASFGCSNIPVSAIYSGDLLNAATTNTLQQLVTATAPIITLNGANPLTNWLNTLFMDPGATAHDLCGGLVPVTTNGSVNSAVPGSYQLQYMAGSPAASTNRTVLVVSELPPAVYGAQLLPNGFFNFSYSGPAGQPYRVMASTNLLNPASWVVVSSGNFGSQATNFADSNVTSQQTRFYRLVSP